MKDAFLTLDRDVFLALNFDGGGFWDSFFWYVSAIWFWIPFYGFLMWVLYRKLGLKGMIIAVACTALGVIIADQIANVFKYGLQKWRPTHNPDMQGLVHTVRGYVGGPYGTVSAHAASAMVIATFATLLFRKWWVGVALYLWALLVCYSRIYLGVHFPADLLFGTIDGIFFGWLTYRVLLWFKKRGYKFRRNADK